MQANKIESNKIIEAYQQSLENQGLTKTRARLEASKMNFKSKELFNNDNPEIMSRIELLSEIPADELEQEFANLITELSSGNYSEQEQLDIANDVFNIIGFSFEKDQNTNQIQLKLIEPEDDYIDEDYYEEETL